MGRVALDGTKLEASASKHKAGLLAAVWRSLPGPPIKRRRMTMLLRTDGRSLRAAQRQPRSHLFVVRAVLGKEFAGRGHRGPEGGR